MLRVGQRLRQSGRQLSVGSSTTTTSLAAGLGLASVATLASVTLLTGTASSHNASDGEVPAGGAHFRAAALLKLPGRVGRDVFTAAGVFLCSGTGQ